MVCEQEHTRSFFGTSRLHSVAPVPVPLKENSGSLQLRFVVLANIPIGFHILNTKLRSGNRGALTFSRIGSKLKPNGGPQAKDKHLL